MIRGAPIASGWDIVYDHYNKNWLPIKVMDRCHVQLKINSQMSFRQVLVELAELQDREVGDGTISVVIIAAELLKVIDTMS